MYYIIIAKKNQAEKIFVDPLITKNCVKIDYFYKIVDILQREEFNDGSLKTLLFLSVFTGRRGAAPYGCN